jgi:tRNA(fMet)-specific endonuclease VapC
MYFLDSNICIYYLKNLSPELNKKLESTLPQKIKIPAMVKAEILTGVEKSGKKAIRDLWTNFFKAFGTASFDGDAARHYSLIRAYLEKKGIPIGPNDLVIAATVAAHGGILVTHNTGEFKRIPNLRIEDWVKK